MLMLSVCILVLAIIIILALEIVKPIVHIPQSNANYFVVVYADKSLKISEEKNEGFLNKIYNPCQFGVIVPFGEEIRVIKPENWSSITKQQSVTNGVTVDFYTKKGANFSQIQIDSLSIEIFRNCGK